jgi:hypothetical protein
MNAVGFCYGAPLQEFLYDFFSQEKLATSFSAKTKGRLSLLVRAVTRFFCAGFQTFVWSLHW